MSSIRDRYIESGIWDMQTPRTSCVVPESPLLIGRGEEYELNELCLAAWNALEGAVELANIGANPDWQKVRNMASAFPESMTLPPAIRIDTVRTANGPKIVEIDPITAISLGETMLLDSIWTDEGRTTISGLTAVIGSSVTSRAEAVNISLPLAKSAYRPEVAYLAKTLEGMGVEVSFDQPRQAAIELSSFMEDPASRKRFNKQTNSTLQNPLWGSLWGLAGKNNLCLLRSADKVRLPRFLPQQYTREELGTINTSQLLLCKPLNGTGSSGIACVDAQEAQKFGDDYAFQEVLTPINDWFGQCTWSDGSVESWPKVSRLSVYAGRCGMIGAQVTARLREEPFTNVHGQDDAVQTALAVW